MKNFFIGVLLTILIVISWPNITALIEETAVSQPVTITVEDRQITNDKPAIEPTAVGGAAPQRAKGRETIQQLFESGERRGRND